MGPYTEDQGTFSSPEVVSQEGQQGEGPLDEVQETETLLPSDKMPAKRQEKVRDYSPLKRLWLETFKPNAGYLTLGVVAMFGSSAANMAFPSLVGRVLDRTATRVDKAASAETCSASSMQSFALRALVVFLGGAVASCVRTHSLRMAREGTTRRLRKKLLKALMRQEKAFFDDTSDGGRRTGQLMSVLEADVEAAGEVFTTRLADGLRSMSSAFNGTAMLLRLSPKLTAVSLGLVPVFSAAIVANVLMTRRLTAKHRELSAAAAAFVNERLGNLTTVHAFTNEGRDAEEYSQLLDQAHEVAAQVSMAKGAFMGGLFFAGSATLTSVLFFGGSLAGAGEMTIGDLTSFCIYTGLVGLGYSGISSWVSDTLKAAVAARRVFDLVDREPVVDPDVGVVPASSAKGDIVFEGVKFAYPSRGEVEVLRGVDLDINQGKVVAFVGPSGAGKSTILSLLLRLYEPSSGRVLLDGVDISTLKPAWVRSQMGLVEQEPALFSGTIADNIRYGKPGATETEVVKAARDADAHEFITAFPDGYATYVGERWVRMTGQYPASRHMQSRSCTCWDDGLHGRGDDGRGNTQLSGGQRQRVALARALIREPPVLLLDEATAHLDNESERLVQKALEKAMHGRTVIIVAHRLSTVEKAGEIVVMEEGQVVERGSFRELMGRDNGHFKALYSVAGSQ